MTSASFQARLWASWVLVFNGWVDNRMAYTIIDKQQVIDTALDREVIAVAPEPAAMLPAIKPRIRYAVNQ
jgi:hypothetical protein